MNEPATRDSSEREIQFVDLLASIVRHRVLVFWTIAIGSLVSVAILFVLPNLGVTLTGEPTVTLQASVRVVTVPTEAQSMVNLDVAAIVVGQRSNLRLVADVYRATLIRGHEATLPKSAVNRIVRTLIDRSFRAVSDSASSTVTLTLVVKAGDQERGSQFLRQFVADCRANLSIYAKAQTEQAIANLQVSAKPITELEAQAQARYEVAARTLKGVLADPDFPMALVGGIDAMDDTPEAPRSVQLLLCLLGSVLIGVLLAFSAEAVSKTRRNPAKVELLRKAWRGE